tara:strand:- start:77 stop:841 length:765 start_codon:yes stop_codon:yes gene_type:complete
MESIYIAQSKSFPGIVKIGRTDRPVNVRMDELSEGDYGPTNFQGDSEWEAVRIIKVDDNNAAEKMLHEHFSDIRVEDRRELFTTDDIDSLSNEAISVVDGTDIVQTFDTADTLFNSADSLFDALGAVSLATGLIITASIFSDHQNVKDAKKWANNWEEKVEHRVITSKTFAGRIVSNVLNWTYWSSKLIGASLPIAVKGFKEGYLQEEGILKEKKEETVLCEYGHKAVKRKNSKNGEYFWGCSEFPKCKWSKNL